MIALLPHASTLNFALRLQITAVAVILVGMVLGGVCLGDETADAQVDGANNRKSVVAESVATTPWFDAEKNELRPIPLQPRVDDTVHRDSRWLPKPKVLTDRATAANQTSPATTTTGQGQGVFGTDFTWGNLFGWALLAATVMMLVGIIVYAVSRAELKMGQRLSSRDDESQSANLPDQQTLERIKHLPPELRRTDVNLRSECERLMNASEFDTAIILLLGHQLLLLDRNGLLRLSRGKTNGGYVRETRRHDQNCAVWLRETADAFEQSYFGRHEIDASVFAELWHQNTLLESAAEEHGGGK